jgi:hypothetical protein
MADRRFQMLLDGLFLAGLRSTHSRIKKVRHFSSVLSKLAACEMYDAYRFLDCIEFQNKIVGKVLLSFTEVEQIESRRSPVESRWVNLQLWEGNGVRTIKFFSIIENMPLEFDSRSRSYHVFTSPPQLTLYSTKLYA